MFCLIFISSIPRGVGVDEINSPSFRLQFLQASDMNADVSSLTTAAQIAALADKLEDAPVNRLTPIRNGRTPSGAARRFFFRRQKPVTIGYPWIRNTVESVWLGVVA